MKMPQRNPISGRFMRSNPMGGRYPRYATQTAVEYWNNGGLARLKGLIADAEADMRRTGHRMPNHTARMESLAAMKMELRMVQKLLRDSPYKS